jgi:hypothetical protein
LNEIRLQIDNNFVKFLRTKANSETYASTFKHCADVTLTYCLFIADRWNHKYVVLDCPTEMAKEIVVSHVRDVTLGKRTYHYLLSGLVSSVLGFVNLTKEMVIF